MDLHISRVTLVARAVAEFRRLVAPHREVEISVDILLSKASRVERHSQIAIAVTTNPAVAAVEPLEQAEMEAIAPQVMEVLEKLPTSLAHLLVMVAVAVVELVRLEWEVPQHQAVEQEAWRQLKVHLV